MENNANSKILGDNETARRRRYTMQRESRRKDVDKGMRQGYEQHKNTKTRFPIVEIGNIDEITLVVCSRSRTRCPFA